MVAPSLAKESRLSQEKLRAYLDYDPETGVFVHKLSRGHAIAGQQAGTVHKKHGHRLLYIECTEYQAHRVAWFWHYGTWPPGQVDHRDEDKDNNRVANLRVASHQQNRRNISKIQRNNTSGFRGVQWNKRQGKWLAGIGIDKRLVIVGRFDSREEAFAARREAELQYFGEFAPSKAA